MKRAAVLVGLSLAAVSQPAAAQIGVTSAIDGRPLAQSPAGAERVLRVGADLQAGERITTGAADRVHLVFLDGTALTIGANSALVTGSVEPGDGKTIPITVTRGTFRIVGGAVNGASEATINTPSGTIALSSAIAAFEVGEGSTKATFLSGTSMSVTALGVTRTATRAGSQITVASGHPPMLPFIIRQGDLAGSEQLERPTLTTTGQPTVPEANRTLVPSGAKAADDNAPAAMTANPDSGPTNTATGDNDDALRRLSRRNSRLEERDALGQAGYRPPAAVVRPQANDARRAVTHHTVHGGVDTRAKEPRKDK